ncbi:MAG: hypothetical protein J6C13_03595 [Clostridia bacterium]|nr:hypothetical protein [Clostridia bacterium]
MWEFEIICDRQNSTYISTIQERLKPILNEVNGVFAIMADEENVYLSLGCEQKKSHIVKANIRLAIADIICENLKFEFLNNHLEFICEDESFKFALAKVCTYFDSELDRQIVLQSLDLKTKKINLDSFFYFKLSSLKQKWQELCNITNKNSVTILRQHNFAELLKFLLSNIDKKCQSVILEMKEKCLIYHDINKDFDIITAIEPHNKIEVLGKLIELNPYLIKIYPDKKNDDTISLLQTVFDDRVVLA